MGRVEEIAKEVDDGRQSGQQQKIAAAAESGRAGPVDRHAQHAQGLRRSTGPVDRKTLTVRPELSVKFGRPGGSTGEEVGRPSRLTDSRVWAKICCSANCETAGYLRAAGVF